MKKKPEISFRIFEGSGPLSIYWHDGPYGDAIESTNGLGVGWFSPDGKLLGVEFDDVDAEADLQELKFKNGQRVRINIEKTKVRVTLGQNKKVSKKRRRAA